MISFRAQDLGKAYKIYDTPLDSLKELVLRGTYHETFWALRGVDFSIPVGGNLGIIGENGAGKSTLLQLMAETIAPTTGALERTGRTSAILELGSGFHDDLTGEENIRIGCSVLGLSPSETEARLPGIIAFSELGDFIDRPVKTYSSGMYVRLGFSIAISVEPDILIVDEALSVGDQHFQKKCKDWMVAFREKGGTLVFCSHNLFMVKQLCDQCLWLKSGHTERLGPAEEVIELYQDYQRGLDAPPADTEQPDTSSEHPQVGENHITYVKLGGDCVDGTIDSGDTLELSVGVHLDHAIEGDAHLGLRLRRNDGIWCYSVTTQFDEGSLIPMGGSEFGAKFVADNFPLLAGKYDFDVYLMDCNGIHAYDKRLGGTPFRVRQRSKEMGMVHVEHRWEKP